MYFVIIYISLIRILDKIMKKKFELSIYVAIFLFILCGFYYLNGSKAFIFINYILYFTFQICLDTYICFTRW